MKRALRYLRIGWTIFFGLLCVSLLVLWVRSYWYVDWVCGTAGFSVSMFRGYVVVAEVMDDQHQLPWRMGHFPLTNSAAGIYLVMLHESHGMLGLRYFSINDRLRSLIVHMTWFVSVTCVLVFAPWLIQSISFSLRTTLIAMTAVAVSLWFIVWMVRR